MGKYLNLNKSERDYVCAKVIASNFKNLHPILYKYDKSKDIDAGLKCILMEQDKLLEEIQGAYSDFL